MGAIGTRLSPRPLYKRAERTGQTSGISGREIEKLYRAVIARSEATKQSSFLSCRSMDCFASLAMTASIAV
jgi:hypothetical protein